ncbi:hypothetical protein FH972_008487 [Carpinus fangiana]|uniref:GRF-type domain-containing protein n=1 Tax=Carpinus fangiana TaxID=176857 RepID=A0A5N6QYZ1_9ROSI|nr:hypothetical protein FH972_008487 [Carpinus fangiana]
MDQSNSEVSDFSDAGAGTNNPMCKCGRRSRILTAFTLPNIGRRFYTCENYVNIDNRGCGFFKWVDMDICQHGKRVVSKLFEWHKNLKIEHAQIGTTISNEILKCKIELAEYKSKMEVGSINFEIQLQMHKNKVHAREIKYQFALACSLIVVAVLMFYPVTNRYSSRFMLP